MSAALASAHNKQPVQGTSPKPAGSTPATDVKAGTPPSITYINPTTGRQGDSVLLLGSNFGSTRGSSYVSFGPFKATVYTAWSDTEIMCAVPPITGVKFPVTGPVTVKTFNGTSNAVAFTALAPRPTITSVYPPFATPNSSVTSVVIAGTGFQTGATVSIWSVHSMFIYHMPSVSNVVVASSKKITCKVTIPSDMLMGPDYMGPPVFYFVITNPDRCQVAGGNFSVYPYCGTGAISPIIGFGVVMGIMTLAGTVRARRRRTKKS